MSLIGIHESRQGSEIISIRVKQYIIDNDKAPIDIGLGPDDIVTLQKNIENKGDKVNKNKNQEQSRNRRSSTNDKQAKLYYDLDPNINSRKKLEKNDQQMKERLFLFNNNNNKLYSHSPGGFNLNSQASFPAYFSELLRISTPTHKKTFWYSLFRSRTNSSNSNNLNRSIDSTYNTNYNDNFVSKGCYYSYNAFTHKDIIVTVDNPGGCQTKMVNCKGEFENDLTNDDWKQVCLSSKLRFYRCSQPLLASFMFSKPIMSVCYYIYEIPYMNSDDFEYCMENYKHDPFSSNDDFEMSIAMALIVNCELKYVLKFIEKYDSKFPRLLLHIIKHISPSSRFCKMLIPILTKHMMMFSDDADIAAIFFDIALTNMRFDICTSFLLPILKNSIWATPYCGISFAKFCIKNNLFDESLEFLNLACVVNAKKQKKYGYNIQRSQTELSMALPRSKSLTESNQQYQLSQSFIRSTSMTLSIKKRKKEKNLKISYNQHNNNSENDYEYEIDDYNETGSNLGLNYEKNNEYISKSLSASASSPQNSRKNSYLEDKNFDHKIDNNDYDFIPTLKDKCSKISSFHNHKKNSYIDGKNGQNNDLNDYDFLSNSRLSSSHNSRKSSYIEDNQHDCEFESLPNSRSSSRLNSNHNSRQNSYIEETKNLPDSIESFFINDFDADITKAYLKCAETMTTPTNSLNYGPSQSSSILLQNHFVTLKSQILFTMSEFIDKIGEADFDLKKEEFVKGRQMADEEEIFFDDEEEIYTSYFNPQNSIDQEEEEEEEEFISNHNKEGFNEICDDFDVADNDNYDYYILSNENETSSKEIFSTEENNSKILDKNVNKNVIKFIEDKKISTESNHKTNPNNYNYNNNNNNDNSNNNDNENGINTDSSTKMAKSSPQFCCNNKSDYNSSTDNTNSISIPKLFKQPQTIKHDLINNIKLFASKAKNRIFFKIKGNENENDSDYNENNTRSLKINIDSLSPMALFDPGIEASLESIPFLPDEISRSMPVSNFFLECLSEIRKDYAESMLILAHQKDVTMSTQTAILFIALSTNDRRLMEAMLNSFTEENRATGTDKLILLRGFTMNVTSNLEAILTIPLEPLTVIEKNALAFMEPFAIGVHRLNNTDL